MFVEVESPAAARRCCRPRCTRGCRRRRARSATPGLPPGACTEQVLEELGYAPDEIDALRWPGRRRLAATRSGRQLPGIARVPHLARDLDQRADVVVGGAVVDEARAQVDAAVHHRPARRRRGRRPAAPGPARRCARSGRRSPGGTCRKGTIESCGSSVSSSRSACRPISVDQQPRLAEVALDRLPERRRAVRAERQPELQRPERPGVLERHVHGVILGRARAAGSPRRGRTPPAGGCGRGRARRRRPWAGRATCARRATRSRPGRARRKLARGRGAAAAGSPYAPSTCSQTPRSAQTSASSSIGSIAPVSVVPAVATTATGSIPAARSRSMAAAVSAARIRRLLVDGQRRGRRPRRGPAPRRPGRPSSAPRPSSRRRPVGPPGRRGATPGMARSRAAASAVRFEIVPPLVNAPPPAG